MIWREATPNFCSGKTWAGEGVGELVMVWLAKFIPKIMTPPRMIPRIMAKIISLRISLSVTSTITGIASEVKFVLICLYYGVEVFGAI